MTPERWQQVKETLAAALEREDTGARTALLDERCANDTALRREVQSLLDQPPDPFESFAEGGGLLHGEPGASDAGRRIGAYELVRELGRGGMGAVWLARRADREFHKEVAIKLLKRGTDTDEVLRRFRAEREILAQLDHPNIARLLDGGTTDEGLPYFVMEYVGGVRVTEFVRERRLGLRDQLQLFLKICSAVERAHQNLVVHRDLKPANILVTSEGEPKLLDFGIAKLLDASGETWEMTLAGRERLTPGYASPEQVRGEPVTTVSDVYALGGILYEMLAGRPAHRFRGSQPTPTEILRVVCDEEPVRPSLAAATPEMRRSLKGDLDTIVLRALAKAPARRYRGAGSLADDLRRFLDGRPVQARPDKVSYRAAKFIGRNKMAAGAAALLMATLIGGAATTLWQAQRAQRRFADVRKIANSFMFEFHDAIRDLPGALAARQLVTRRAVEYLDSLAADAGNDLSLQQELAIAYQKIANITFDTAAAVEAFRKAMVLNEALVAAAPQNANFRRQLADCYHQYSDALKIAGRSKEAIDYARRALALFQEVAVKMPVDVGSRLAAAHYHVALAVALDDAGDFRGALQSHLEAIALQEAAVKLDPANDHAQHDLGASHGRISDAYADVGDFPQAVASARRELEIKERALVAEPANNRHRRAVWFGHYHLGRHLGASGEHTSAAEHLVRAVAIMEALAAVDPGDKGHRRWLAVTNHRLGEVVAHLGQTAEALKYEEKAIALSDELAREDASRMEARRDLVEMNTAAGRLLSTTEPERALILLTRATSLGEELASHDPENGRIRSALAAARSCLADCHRTLAAQPHLPPSERVARLRAARDCYARSLAELQNLEQRGMLTARDAQQPKRTSDAIAECDAALAELTRGE